MRHKQIKIEKVSIDFMWSLLFYTSNLMLCILILDVYTGKNPETRFDLEILGFDFAHSDLNSGSSIVRSPIFNPLGEHERDMSIACKWWSGSGNDLCTHCVVQ